MDLAVVFFHRMRTFGSDIVFDQNKTKKKRKRRSVSVPVRFSA